MYLAPFLIGGLSLAGCASSAGGGGGAPATVEDWTFGPWTGRKITTAHFDLHSTLSDRDLEEALPGFVEAAHAQYTGLLPPPAGTDERLRTFLFDNRGQWETFSRARFPERYPVYSRISAGGFADGDTCVVYYIQRSYTLAVLAHEGLHQYFGSHFAEPLPAWLNEGLATYCESFELSGNRPVFTPRRNTFRLNALRNALTTRTALPLHELLDTDAGKVIVEGQSRQVQNYYAQVWALAVYLRHGATGRYAPGFERLLADIAAGRMGRIAQAARIRAPHPSATSFGEAVFRAYVSEDLAGFEADYVNYLHELAGFKPNK